MRAHIKDPASLYVAVGFFFATQQEETDSMPMEGWTGGTFGVAFVLLSGGSISKYKQAGKMAKLSRDDTRGDAEQRSKRTSRKMTKPARND